MVSKLASQLLPGIYESCENGGAWRHVLDQLCAGLGVRSAAVQMYRRSGFRLVEQWSARDSYSHAHADEHDRWINNDDNPRLKLPGAPNGIPKVVTDRDRFAPNSGELDELRRRLAKAGLKGGAGMIFEASPSRYFTLILHRAIDDSTDVSTQDAELLEELAPHLQRASRIAEKLDRAKDAEANLARVADRLRVGVILCRVDGEVRWCNRAAEAIIGRSSAMSLANGWLRANTTASREILGRMLSGSHERSLAQIARIDQRDGLTIQIAALPLRGSESGSRMPSAEGDIVALVLHNQAEASPFCVDAVASLFGLAPAEARLSVALCRGLSLADYAAERGISVGTARVQLKRALSKTNSRRQGELVGKLYGSVLSQIDHL